MHYIGKINKNKLGIFKNKIIDEDIILTEERRIHIYKNHKKDYEEIINNLDRTVLNPNEILLDSQNKNTIFLIISHRITDFQYLFFLFFEFLISFSFFVYVYVYENTIPLRV